MTLDIPRPAAGPQNGRSLIATESLQAHSRLKGQMTFCSTRANWRSLLLRAYVDPPNVEELTTAATPDQLIVLVTSGSCDIESRCNGGWAAAAYRTGHIGLVGPYEVADLRWRSSESHSNLQVHIPAAIIGEAAAQFQPNGLTRLSALTSLSQRDLTISSMIVALERAARAGAPDLYAETAARFLALHLMTPHGSVLRPMRAHAASLLAAVEAFMRENLAKPITLAQLSEVAGLGRFQLLRETKRVWGETPLRRLTRLRMEHAQHLLLHSRHSIIEIALDCGYENPTHFATAFRRELGVAPSDLRR